MRIAFFLASVLAWPAFGGECFCLVDADDAIWFECREQPRPMRTQPPVFCTDTDTGEQVELTGRQDLVRVADGDAPCTPCRLSDATDLDHVIRGGNDEGEESASRGTEGITGEGRP